jgi:hypothetical protein
MMVVGSAGFMAALRQMRQEAAGNAGT